MNQITLPAQFDNISLRKDGSCLLKFETRELSAEELFTILQYRNTDGWLLFSQNKDMKAPEIEAELDTKSPSERLKNALYVRFMDKKVVGTFRTYYEQQMEKVIQQVLKDITK